MTDVICTVCRNIWTITDETENFIKEDGYSLPCPYCQNTDTAMAIPNEETYCVEED